MCGSGDIVSSASNRNQGAGGGDLKCTGKAVRRSVDNDAIRTRSNGLDDPISDVTIRRNGRKIEGPVRQVTGAIAKPELHPLTVAGDQRVLLSLRVGMYFDFE